MELQEAIEMLRVAVKNNGTNDQRHIDLTLVPAEEKDKYQEALVVAQLAVKDGKLTRDELMARLHLV